VRAHDLIDIITTSSSCLITWHKEWERMRKRRSYGRLFGLASHQRSRRSCEISEWIVCWYMA
jgi:hypothetical protein